MSVSRMMATPTGFCFATKTARSLTVMKFLQSRRNLIVKSKPPIEELREVVKLREEVERELAGKGRVLLRYSGTESKIRLLIEGRELDKIDKQANRIADAIQSAIGAN